MSKFASKTHKSYKLAEVFEEAKCRLRTVNYTRWTSSFLMMLSFLKAFSRKCFTDAIQFPVNHSDLEIYVQILLPIHKFSLAVQCSSCSIGRVLPMLWLLIHGTLERFQLSNEPKVFRDLLLQAIKKKFDYELKSSVYLAAAVLNVDFLSMWAFRSFSKELLKRALEILPEVGLLILKQQVNEANARETNAEESESETESLFGFKIQNKLSKSCTLSNINDEVTASSVYLQLEDEKNKYINLLRETEYNKKQLSLAEFWVQYRSRLPLLNDLALHLLVIPASSAYIERFFSISGLINAKRSGNMSSETLRMKALLKANSQLITKSLQN